MEAADHFAPEIALALSDMKFHFYRWEFAATSRRTTGCQRIVDWLPIVNSPLPDTRVLTLGSYLNACLLRQRLDAFDLPCPRLRRKLVPGDIEAVLFAFAVSPWQEPIEDMAYHFCADILQPPKCLFQLAGARIVSSRNQQNQIATLGGD